MGEDKGQIREQSPKFAEKRFLIRTKMRRTMIGEKGAEKIEHRGIRIGEIRFETITLEEQEALGQSRTFHFANKAGLPDPRFATQQRGTPLPALRVIDERAQGSPLTRAAN